MALLQQIERSFVASAEGNDDVRAALVVGSQARVDHPADEWADLDIILFANHVERYQERTDWIEQLAPVWIAIAGRTVGGDPERLVLFEGGVQVDFAFNHPELLRGAGAAGHGLTLPFDNRGFPGHNIVIVRLAQRPDCPSRFQIV